MVSTFSVIIFSCALVALGIFFVWSVRSNKKRALLSELFKFFAIAYASWLVPLIIMRFADINNRELMFVLDCLMQPGGALSSPLYLCIAITFVEGYKKMQRWMKLLFIVPVMTILVSWTNPLHHLY